MLRLVRLPVLLEAVLRTIISDAVVSSEVLRLAGLDFHAVGAGHLRGQAAAGAGVFNLWGALDGGVIATHGAVRVASAAWGAAIAGGTNWSWFRRPESLAQRSPKLVKPAMGHRAFCDQLATVRH